MTCIVYNDCKIKVICKINWQTGNCGILNDYCSHVTINRHFRELVDYPVYDFLENLKESVNDLIQNICIIHL